MNTKRIKIERPKDLREGMRVEVMYSDDEPLIGKVWKGENPYSNELYYSIPNGSNEVSFNLVTVHGEYKRDIECVYRLIDGIEDVVVGDDLKDEHAYIGTVAERLLNSVLIDNDISCSWMTLNHLKEQKIKIHISEEATTKPCIDKETETGDDTNVAATQILHMARFNKFNELMELFSLGVEPENIVIKKDE